MKLFWMAAILMSMVGCGISVIPLTPDGKKSAEVEGVRYYLPKPYLLVAKVPKDLTSEQSVRDADGGKKDEVKDDKKPVGPEGDSGGASSGGNTSFQKDSKSYSVKLIYLPDFCHPMAIQQNTWLWGSSQMKPTLQDGWMLTSLDAASDSKTAETITAMAALVSAVKGAGGTSGTTSITGVDPTGVLKAGLYEFFQEGDHLSVGLVTDFSSVHDLSGSAHKVNVLAECARTTN